MALETATYFPDLVVGNPAPTDGVNQADDHIRLMKSVLKNTFPNWTSAALVSTQAAIDAAVAAIAGTAAITLLAGTVSAPGLRVLGSLTTGLYSPGANQLGVTVNGQSSQVWNADKSVNFAGAVAAAGNLSSLGTVAASGSFLGGLGELAGTGMMMMWPFGPLPTGWVYANGQAISRTGASLALFNLWGTQFGAGNGSTTFNVLNMQEVVPVGQSTMGGAASPARMPTTANIGTLGAVVGEEKHTLAAGELPAHLHPITDVTHDHNMTIDGGGATNTVSVAQATGQCANSGGIGQAANHTLDIVPALSGINTTQNNVGGGSGHNNVQTSMVVAYIIKL